MLGPLFCTLSRSRQEMPSPSVSFAGRASPAGSSLEGRRSSVPLAVAVSFPSLLSPFLSFSPGLEFLLSLVGVDGTVVYRSASVVATARSLPACAANRQRCASPCSFSLFPSSSCLLSRFFSGLPLNLGLAKRASLHHHNKPGGLLLHLLRLLSLHRPSFPFFSYFSPSFSVIFPRFFPCWPRSFCALFMLDFVPWMCLFFFFVLLAPYTLPRFVCNGSLGSLSGISFPRSGEYKWRGESDRDI